MLVVLKYLTVHPCVDCGETDPRVLDFDHDGEKNFTIGDALTRSCINPDNLTREIALCTVRCSNCHRKRHNLKSYRGLSIADLEAAIHFKKANRKYLSPHPRSDKPLPRKRRSVTNLMSRETFFTASLAN